MISGTGVPDDCSIDTGSRCVSLRDLLFRDVQTSALHAETLHPLVSRIRIVPAHSSGIVVELSMEIEGMEGRRRRRIYALPDTVFRCERGSVPAAQVVVGDQLLPDYAEIKRIRTLLVQADFCKPVSQSPVFVDVGGMYVLTTMERN